MKKNLVLTMLLLVIAATTANAQVTIGSEYNPHSGALLDLKEENTAGTTNSTKGLLLPRVELTDYNVLTVVAEPTPEQKLSATGMIVWNTNKYALNGKGTYQWDGGQWLPIKTTPPTGKLAYRNSTEGAITGYLDFLTFNLGADPNLSIKQQLLAPIPPANVIPGGDDTSAQNVYTAVYGSKYQWGREPDGHQNVWSGTFGTQISELKFANTEETRFIIGSTDWLAGTVSSNGHDRWLPVGTAAGINDPCPKGFRIPTQAEWESLLFGVGGGNSAITDKVKLGVNRWVWVSKDDNLTTAIHGADLHGVKVNTAGILIYPPKSDTYNNPPDDSDYETTPELFLPAAGYRYGSNGTLDYAGVYGYYWSSTVRASDANFVFFSNTYVGPTANGNRADGFSARCLAE